MASVHDNEVYAQAVDYEGRRLVLHTVRPSADPPGFTDVVFGRVVAHHFEYEAFRGGGMSANILFDIEEKEAAPVLGRYANLLTAAKNYGWPVPDYDSPDDLAAWLAAAGAKCFEVHSSCGLSGFVFAASMEFRGRRARVVETDTDAAPDRPGV